MQIAFGNDHNPPGPSEAIQRDYDQFFLEADIEEDDLLAQIFIQSSEGMRFALNMRELLQADYNLYENNPTKEGEQVGDPVLYNVVRQRLARAWTDQPVTEFEANIASAAETVATLNNVFKSDFKEDYYAALMYSKEWYRQLFGVGIIFKNGWDGGNKRPTFQVVDPRIWLPDPNGNYVTMDYQFNGFERLVSQEELLSGGYMNLEKLGVQNYSSYISGSLQKYRDQQTVGLWNLPTTTSNNPYFDLYYHYFFVQDKEGRRRKAMAVMGNYRNLILQLKLLPAVSKEQKKNPELINFPFSFHYDEPEPNNPYGGRVANRVRNVQLQKQLLATLRLKKVKAQLFPMYFVNEKYIGNKTELQFGFNKFISVNSGDDGPVPMDSIVRAFKPDAGADNTWQIDDSLDKQITRSTSVGDAMQGMSPDGKQTATETNTIETNTDIALAVPNKIDNWGMRQFVANWLDGYLENFESGDKKFIILNTGVGNVPVTLTRAQFLYEQRITISITSGEDIRQKRNKERLALTQNANVILAAPQIPDFSKRLVIRDLMKASGYDPEKIATRLGVSPEEEKAKGENAMLVNGMRVKVKPEDDDLLHLIMHKAAGEGEEAVLHINDHIRQYISKGSPQPQTSAPTGMQQSMMASQASQIAGQEWKQLASPL